MTDPLVRFKQVLADVASKRLARPLSSSENSGIDALQSMLIIETILSEFEYRPVSQVEAMLKALPALPSSPDDADQISCRQCSRLLATWDPQQEAWSPSWAEREAEGHIGVPQFASFCGAGCASRYEEENGVRFQRDPTTGRIVG
jgi:hypothetical protein